MPVGISWPPSMPTQYEALASSFHGICQSAEKLLLEQLLTTIAQHWSAVGICSNLLGSSLPSNRIALMEVLENLSVSFVSHERVLLDCITAVSIAKETHEQQEQSTSQSGKTP